MRRVVKIYPEWIKKLTPGEDVMFVHGGQLRVSSIVSVDGIIILRNGMRFLLSGESERHSNVYLIPGSPESLEEAKKKQEVDSMAYFLLEFFSDSHWYKKISPLTLKTIHTAIVEDLSNDPDL